MACEKCKPEREKRLELERKLRATKDQLRRVKNDHLRVRDDHLEAETKIAALKALLVERDRALRIAEAALADRRK